jgi:hypothetical protein
MKSSLTNLTVVLTGKGKTLTQAETCAIKGGCGCDIRKPPLR